MSTPLTLRTDDGPDGRPVLVAKGEIDVTNLAAFRAALDEAVAAHGTVVVDLAGVDYLDSGAINALFTHAERLHVISNPVLMSALRISGLTDLTTVDPAS